MDKDGNYTLLPNDRPLAVLWEESKPLILGSDDVNGHLFAITYRDQTIWFSKEKTDTHISGRIVADYRKDIGAPESYRDYTRFIHVKYEWNMRDWSVKELNRVARGALIAQNQPELGCERFKKLEKVHGEIDQQPNLKTKKNYALKHSTFRSDPRDNYRTPLDLFLAVLRQEHIPYKVSKCKTRHLPIMDLPE